MRTTANRSAKGKAPDLARGPGFILDQDHRQIEHHLEVMAWILECLPPRGELSLSQGHAFANALTYFAREAAWHTRDEELSLFSRLRTAADRRGNAALAQLTTLEQEHVAVLKLHDQLDAAARIGLRADRFTPAQKKTVQQLLAQLQTAYRRHMEVEDREVFPMATAVLGPGQMKKIDQEISRRRADLAAPGES